MFLQADPTVVIAGDLHQHIRRSSSSASRQRRNPEDSILIMPNVTAVVSPAERELLAAKEKALQEEVNQLGIFQQQLFCCKKLY